jgi:hypothetical protein
MAVNRALGDCCFAVEVIDSHDCQLLCMLCRHQVFAAPWLLLFRGLFGIVSRKPVRLFKGIARHG